VTARHGLPTCPGWLGVAERRGLLRVTGSGAALRHATIEMTQ
jgi:hypothetical protein